ncbi:hypothetical protein FUAX_14750 [Fulvitalea axinellae]|uniref:Uncharacterized protein n=1 Tax=Fulvitalea axinellae TaxID=1182444 RepID=A0AAU9CGA6_9BACT|nr:hypothetical protein FUAX_14750 [Fulvitalea axinellae]
MNREYFLSRINQIQLDTSLSWVEKSTALKELIERRDFLMRRHLEEVYKIITQIPSDQSDSPFRLN